MSDARVCHVRAENAAAALWVRWLLVTCGTNEELNQSLVHVGCARVKIDELSYHVSIARSVAVHESEWSRTAEVPGARVEQSRRVELLASVAVILEQHVDLVLECLESWDRSDGISDHVVVNLTPALDEEGRRVAAPDGVEVRLRLDDEALNFLPLWRKLIRRHSG